nr:ferritin-like domain-containing protein [Bacteroidota bacterium]
MIVEKDHSLDLLRMQLNDIYFIENQLVTALEINARAATDPELIAAFRSHRTETIQHVHRV